MGPTTTTTVERLVPQFMSCLGEGPHWCEKEAVLYYVDILPGHVCRYNPATGENTFVKVNGNDTVSLVVPIQDRPNEFIVTRGREVCRLHWDVNQPRGPDGNMQKHWVVVLGEVDKHSIKNRFNDGKCDEKGRLWSGTMGYEKFSKPGQVAPNEGSMYVSTPKLDNSMACDITKKFGGITISNGLCWSPDSQTLYFIDTPKRCVEAFDYDATTALTTNRRTVFDFETNNVKGHPDGMTVDTNGHLWVACFAGSQVIEIDPQNGGKLVSQISLAGKANNITSVTFGGPDYTDLFVTSGRIGSAENFGPEEGGLFVIRGHGARGMPAYEFDPVVHIPCTP